MDLTRTGIRPAIMASGIRPAVMASGIRPAVMASRDFASGLFDRLRRDGLDKPGVSRDPYGPGEQRAHATVTAAAQKLGLCIEHDAAANLYMTLPAHDPAAKHVIVGSHLDSVPHGRNLDGPAGLVP